jgi:hypothetical protein
VARADTVRYRPIDGALLIVADSPYDGPGHVTGPAPLAALTA